MAVKTSVIVSRREAITWPEADNQIQRRRVVTKKLQAVVYNRF